MNLEEFIKSALAEDIGDGDHSSLACLKKEQKGKAHLLVKENGIIAGVDLAKQIFSMVDLSLQFESFKNDGDIISINDIVFNVIGNSQSILKAERLVLNCMQRMSAIATNTARYVEELKGLADRKSVV